jgi:polyphosphate kinase
MLLPGPGAMIAGDRDQPGANSIGTGDPLGVVYARPAPAPAGASVALLDPATAALEFHARVLELAADPSLPLLERVRFAAIVSDALDEFFAIRVAGLMGQGPGVMAARRAGGPSPARTLAAIRARAVDLTARQSRVWGTLICPALTDAGIEVRRVADLCPADMHRLRTHFEQQLLPAIEAVPGGRALPHVAGLGLNVAVRMLTARGNAERLLLVPLPAGAPRFVMLDAKPTVLLALEDVLAHFAPLIAPGRRIVERAAFRVTRDSDFDVSDSAEDLVAAVREGLGRRPFGGVCRLEVAASTSREMVDRLVAGLGVRRAAVYRVRGLLALSDAVEIAALDRPELKHDVWRPTTPPRLAGTDQSGDIFARLRGGDVLVHHPYDSAATSFERFVHSAADDPHVRALKTTLYRIGDESPIVPALVDASETGKQVVCLVELRARGDEHQNIACGHTLERAGVHVVYGFPRLKVHAKATLVVRREGDRLRRYAHIGTGNYPAHPARIYEDFGLFTADDDIAADVADLFNFLSGFGRPQGFRKLLVAPLNLRPRLVELIASVAAAAAAGERAEIRLKVNALTDQGVIDELCRASQAGATIDVVARSISTLRPGVPGVSENIRIRSVVGRFLEHSRVFVFHAGAASTFLIGSADLMPRNLDHRVEVVAPVERAEAQAELTTVLDTLLADNRNAWEQLPSGDWRRLAPGPGERPVVAQSALMLRAVTRDRGAGASPRAPARPMEPIGSTPAPGASGAGDVASARSAGGC